MRSYATREPIGVVGIISPWNLPLYLLSFKVAPALACGNCVIAKPSEITPRTAGALAQLLHAAGLPPGVFNLVHGLGAEAGAALVAHPDVHVVSFTGGTATGRAVAAVAAPLFKKLSLELGGKVGGADSERWGLGWMICTPPVYRRLDRTRPLCLVTSTSRRPSHRWCGRHLPTTGRYE